MKYAFIERHCESYPVQALCTALEVSDSGFASWQRGDGPSKWLSDSALLKLIKQIYAKTEAAYGSRRIFQEIKARGHPVSEGRVERLMRGNGIRARHKRLFKATTESSHSLPIAPNRLVQKLHRRTSRSGMDGGHNMQHASPLARAGGTWRRARRAQYSQRP